MKKQSEDEAKLAEETQTELAKLRNEIAHMAALESELAYLESEEGMTERVYARLNREGIKRVVKDKGFKDILFLEELTEETQAILAEAEKPEPAVEPPKVEITKPESTTGETLNLRAVYIEALDSFVAVTEKP